MIAMIRREHVGAFIWLRWRLLRNQYRRAGALNAVLMIAVLVIAIVTAVPALIGSFLLGVYAIPKATPAQLMYAWDGLVCVFLFFWCIGLVAELQRSEPLALAKFLHLPVSVNEAFLINYVSSLLRFSLIVFGPIMLGFALALVYAKGIALLPVLPLLAAFVLMISALTYQFQGWLAALMSNPRRRRTVIVVFTMVIIAIAQVPNAVNMLVFGGSWRQARVRQQQEAMARMAADRAELERDREAQRIDNEEYVRRMNALMPRYQRTIAEADRRWAESFQRIVRLVNVVLPIGWLPAGVMSAAEGTYLMPLLGIGGMTAIGGVSLRRAYGTTLGLYQGQASNSGARPRRNAAAAPAPSGRRFLERRIPGCSEPVSAIALGGLRAILRSPEAKMALLTPVIMSGIFGAMIFRGQSAPVEALRPLLAAGGISLSLLGVMQLAGNQFGFDRDGFRVFVLSSVSRRDILLGKNLAHAPLVLVLGLVLIVLVQCFCPLRIDHFLSLFPQLISMFVLFCVFTNFSSIYAPLRIAVGTLKPSNMKLTTALVQLVLFCGLFPLSQGLTLLPLGIEQVSEFLGWTDGLPVCLILSALGCPVAVAIYWLALAGQGRLLQAREQRILEVVTNRGT